MNNKVKLVFYIAEATIILWWFGILGIILSLIFIISLGALKLITFLVLPIGFILILNKSILKLISFLKKEYALYKENSKISRKNFTDLVLTKQGSEYIFVSESSLSFLKILKMKIKT